MLVSDVAALPRNVCVLRKARIRRSGAAYVGTLAAAVPAISGHWRIGGGSAGCNEFLAILSRRARRYAIDNGQVCSW